MSELFQYVQTGGSFGTIILVLYLLWKGELIWRRDHETIIKAKDTDIAKQDAQIARLQGIVDGHIARAMEKLDRLEHQAERQARGDV